MTVLESAEPSMPLEDRAADTWEPLSVVADHAGAHWPDRARSAAVQFTAEAADNGDMSTRVRLLIDCRDAFEDQEAIPTTVLIERLRRDPEAPWREYGPQGLTAMKLGQMLREYEIRSSTMRFPGLGQAKGYCRIDFNDAWGRYCPEPLTLPGQSPPGGEAVPAVTASTSQVSAVRLDEVVRLSRTTETSRTSLTSTNEAVEAGTAHPPLRVIGGAR
jgi:hypothetical protein